MNEFIVIKIIPYGGHEGFMHLRWDPIFTKRVPFHFCHYKGYEEAKSACQSPFEYPVKKSDFLPVMSISEWDQLQASYMEVVKCSQ